MNKYNGKEVSADGYKESDCSLIEIPVPWGIVSGKTWGNKTDMPIILLHGIQDNCGSFDNLIPLLPKEYFFVCLDLPGHGWSSHFPEGLPLDFLNYILSVKLVIEYFGMTYFYMIGHSLGAQISLLFSALYPEFVLKLILLDGYPRTVKEKQTSSHLRSKLDTISEHIKKMSLKKKSPTYTYEEALERLKISRISKFTDESAHILLKRGLIKSELDAKYYFSSDQRLKLIWRPLLSNSQLRQLILSVKCPILFIMVKETYDTYFGNRRDKCLMFQLYLQGIKHLHFVVVDGHHDIHLDSPKTVAFPIKSFLESKNFR